MLTLIKSLLERNSLYLATGITIIITYLSLVKLEHNLPIQVSNLDKYEHAIAYFSLGYSWLLFFRDYSKKYIVVLSVIAFGILIEGLQMLLTDYRTGDLYDVFANSTGVLLARIIFRYHNKPKL